MPVTLVPRLRCPHALRMALPLLGVVAPGRLPAQSPVPQVSAMALLTSGNGPQCQAPSMVATQADWTHVSATAYSAPLARATRFGTSTPVVALSARTPAHRGWTLMMSGAVGIAGSDCMALAGQPRALLQLSRAIHNGGVSVGYGHRSLSPLDATRDRQGLTVGVWQRVRGVNASLDLRALGRVTALGRTVWNEPLAVYTDSASVPAPTRQTIITQVPSRLVDLRSRFQFHAGPVLFDITGGSTISHRIRPLPWMQDTLFSSSARSRSNMLWGRTEAQVPITRWVMVRAGVAALPTQPDMTSPVRAVYSFGVQLARWPRRGDTGGDSVATGSRSRMAFEAILNETGQLRLRLRHDDAASVRVSGEPTHWAPVPMIRAAHGWWEATLPVGPGTYRLNISIDEAAWQPPPGLPTARDEFGGRVGLITVR
ncbi:MAG TPA: hypothetical protein DGD08_06140 [Gemmatimonas aurantiaca]|uniref:Uncharacterized protein n=2 Tax=Gemmatimonas aurantiaca TaxID=173480 RepID=C1A6Z1_GEMAT|nr:glycogen-binding domain-containing protein [Gemmatimonas aurantiaca]BAH38001.1 hypothetical protein GAU_0959 [Gemmatimonas aurantiaca T-27]HCT56776.1 hypothetical protein [Gemmatimonas aurantiaca]